MITIQNVKEYFKKAVQIETPVFKKICFLEEYDLENLFRANDGIFADKKDDKGQDVQLYSITKGFAKIIK